MKYNTATLFNFIVKNIPIHFINILTSLMPNHGITTKIRGYLISFFLKDCGKGFKIASGVIINRPDKISIGNNVYIAHDVWINAGGEIKIGDNTIIGPKCVITTSKHIFENGLVTHNSNHNPIEIGKGTWLASNVVVTDGVKIGDGVLVGAGAVVTKDLENNIVAVGVPAVEVKRM